MEVVWLGFWTREFDEKAMSEEHTLTNWRTGMWSPKSKIVIQISIKCPKPASPVYFSLWFKSNVVLIRHIFSDGKKCLVFGWASKKKKVEKMQTIFHLQKVETSVWLPEDYKIISGKKSKPYNLERNKVIRTRPSFLKVHWS